MTEDPEGRRGPVIGIVGHDHTVARPFGDLPVHAAPRSYAAGVGGLVLTGGATYRQGDEEEIAVARAALSAGSVVRDLLGARILTSALHHQAVISDLRLAGASRGKSFDRASTGRVKFS